MKRITKKQKMDFAASQTTIIPATKKVEGGIWWVREEVALSLEAERDALRAENERLTAATIVSPDGVAYLCLPLVRELYYNLRAELAAAQEQLRWRKWPDEKPKQPGAYLAQIGQDIRIKKFDPLITSHNQAWKHVKHWRNLPDCPRKEKE